MADFLADIRSVVSFLVGEKGFRQIEQTYEPEHFGNGIAVLESSDLQVRFSKDKGQYWSEFGAVEDSEWWLLHDVCVLLDVTNTFSSNLHDFSLQENIFRSIYPRLLIAFSPVNANETKAKLRVIVEARTKRFLAKLGRKA